MKGAKSKSSAKPADTKLAVKKNGKAAKDPNKPKRAASAFFVFMEDFRVKFKEEHPNNNKVAAVGKAGGQKWKAMSDADKAPYIETALKRKKAYDKDMAAYNKKLAGKAEPEPEPEAEAKESESDKSKSEVHDDEEEASDEDHDEDEDDD